MESSVFLFLFQLLQFLQEGFDILEFTVDRSEAHVGDLVSCLKMLHDDLTDLGGGDLINKRIMKLVLDLLRQLLGVHGTLLTSLEKSRQKLIAVKKLLGAVLLHNDDLNRFYYFKGGKPLLTSQALSSATDAVPLLHGTGIDHLTICKSTSRTLHSFMPVEKSDVLSSIKLLVYFTTNFMICKEIS